MPCHQPRLTATCRCVSTVFFLCNALPCSYCYYLETKNQRTYIELSGVEPRTTRQRFHFFLSGDQWVMMFTRRRRRRRRVADWLIAWLFTRGLRHSCEERKSKLLAFQQYNAIQVPWRSSPCT